MKVYIDTATRKALFEIQTKHDTGTYKDLVKKAVLAYLEAKRTASTENPTHG